MPRVRITHGCRVCALPCSAAVPFQVAFDEELRMMAPGVVDAWNIVDWVMDFIFIFDIFVNFRTGYVKRGMFVTDARLVAKRYLSTWFPIDLVSSLPLSFITFIIENSQSEVDSTKFAGINRLLRMLKLSKLFRILKVARSLKFIADVAHFNPGMARLIASLFLLLLVCHWIACFYYLVAYDDLRSRPPAANDTNPLDYPLYLIQGPPGSVPLLKCWRWAFYWSSSIMSGMVTFDVTPEDDAMMSYTTVAIYVGLLFNVVILSTANSAVSSVDSIAQDSKRKLDRVTAYLRFQGVNQKLRIQITEFYKHALSSSQTLESQTLTSELPRQLAAALMLDTHRPLIAQCALFHVVDHATILELLRALEPCTIPLNVTVMKEAHPIGALYFIIRGLVQLTSNRSFSDMTSDFGIPSSFRVAAQPRKHALEQSRRQSRSGDGSMTTTHTKLITDHAFFGEDAMLDRQARAYFTALSLTYVNAVLLSRHDFERVAEGAGGADAVRQKWLAMRRTKREATSAHEGGRSSLANKLKAVIRSNPGGGCRSSTAGHAAGAATAQIVLNPAHELNA